MIIPSLLAHVIFYIGLMMLICFLVPRLPRLKLRFVWFGRKLVRLTILVKENWNEAAK